MEGRAGPLAWLAHSAFYQLLHLHSSHVVRLFPAFEQQIQQDPHSQVWVLFNIAYLLYGGPSFDSLHAHLSHLS